MDTYILKNRINWLIAGAFSWALLCGAKTCAAPNFWLTAPTQNHVARWSCWKGSIVTLNPNMHMLLDGEVKVCKRGNSKRWQATFKIDQHWVRISTGKTDLEEAKTLARDQYLEYNFRTKQTQHSWATQFCATPTGTKAGIQ